MNCVVIQPHHRQNNRYYQICCSLRQKVQLMHSVSSLILLFPLTHLIWVDVDNQPQKPKRNDRNNHIVPLRFPTHKNGHHQQPITNEKRFDQPYQTPRLLSLTIPYLTSNINMRNNKKDKRSCEKEDRTDKQCFVKLLIRTLILSFQPLHNP